MYVLKTIEEIFAHNLRDLRGNGTQADVAHGAKIPFRTYQRLEAGTIPKTRHYVTSLAKYHSVSEGRLFLDPDLVGGGPTDTTAPGSAQSIFELIRLLATLDDPNLASEILDVVKNTLRLAGKLNEGQVDSKKSLRK